MKINDVARAMAVAAVALMAGGCPFLWGPPDYHYETGTSDADTDVDVDSDADADVDTDTVVDDDPLVTSFEASLAFDEVTLAFTVADASGDLAGGDLQLTEGTAPVEVFSLDDGLATWDESTGTGTLLRAQPPICVDVPLSYTIIVTDAGGHPSEVASAALEISGMTVAESATPVPFTVTPPVVLCGDHANASDIDAWDVTFTVGGTYTVYIEHEFGADRDVGLANAAGVLQAQSNDTQVPDRLVSTFEVGTTYHIQVIQDGGGSGGTYTVVISL